MSVAHDALQPMRGNLAHALPAIVAGYLVYIPRDRDPWVVHLLVAVFAGLVLTGFGYLALIATAYVVTRVGTSDDAPPDFNDPVVRRMMTAALLLVAGMWVNELMRGRVAERHLIRCVRDWDETRSYTSRTDFASSATDAVISCVHDEGLETRSDD